ncbi:MAG: polysaccharide biosynthesis C-terminal domain-containing protein [Burkholderiales bacterium]|nr:polysaccharide biosynthesis C-terminal domain-containing protein [Burkholderiales bacterium]
MTRSSLTRSALWNLLARLATVGLGLVLLALVARHDPALQGQLSLLIAAESIAVSLWSGLGLVIARQVSHHHEQAHDWVVTGLRVAVGAGAVTALALWGLSAVAGLGPSYGFLPWLALAMPLLLVAPTVSGAWLGEGRMAPLNLTGVLPPALALAVVGALSLSGRPLDAASVVVAWLGSRSLWGAWLLLRHARPTETPARLGIWAGQARFCAVLGLTNLVSWLNFRVDLFLVEQGAGLTPAAVYAVAVSVTELLWFVSSAVSTAAYARIGAAARGDAARLAVRIIHVNLLLLMLVGPCLPLAGAGLLPWLLGPAYDRAWVLICLLLPGVWAYAAATTLSAFYTNQLGRPGLSAAVAGVSLGINLLLCQILIPLWGAAGAAVATSASYVLAIGVGLELFRRHAGLRWPTLLRIEPRLLWAAWRRRDGASP